MRAKSVKLYKDITGVNLHSLRLGNVFLAMTTKVQEKVNWTNF